jgi:hypothetical protein
MHLLNPGACVITFISTPACIERYRYCLLLETFCYLPAVQIFTPISSLSFTRNNSLDCTYHATHLSNTPSVSFFSTSLGAPTHFSCALVQYMFSRFSHIAHICLIVAQFITFHRVKPESSIFKKIIFSSYP